MPTLMQIYQNNAQYCKNSGIVVEVNRAFSWVTITDDNANELFLQGYDADEFIDRVDAIAEQEEDMSYADAELVIAYDYLDVLGPRF